MEAEQQPKKRTKVGVTIAMKKVIIAKHEAGARVSEIARQYGRSTSTISTIISQKERLKRFEVAKGVTLITKQRSEGIDDIEKELLVWLNDSEICGSGVPNEATIRCKARQLYRGMVKAGVAKRAFKASRGWYENFRKRSGLFKNQTRKIRDDGYPTLKPELQQQSFYCHEKGITDKDGQLKHSTEELFDPSADKTRDDISISAFYKSEYSDVDFDPEQNSEDLDARREGEQEENHQSCSRVVDGTRKGEPVKGVPSSVIKKMCGEWEEIRGFVQMCYPDQTIGSRAIQTFDDIMSYFRHVVKSRGEQYCDNGGEFVDGELQPVLEDEPKKSRRKNNPPKKLIDISLSEDSDLM